MRSSFGSIAPVCCWAIFLLFTASIGQAQLIRSDAGYLFEDNHFFNERFIRENKIRTITGEVSRKESMRPIIDQGLIWKYEFNKDGKLIRQTKTFKRRGGIIDSSSIAFAYDDVNRLVAQNARQNHVFDAITLTYDSAGRVQNKAFYRGEDTSRVTYQFEPGRAFRINADSFSYEQLSAVEMKQRHYNSDGKPYMETFITYDSLGNVIEENTRYTLTGRSKNTSYTYDHLGRLQAVKSLYRMGSRREKSYTYRYNEAQQVDMEQILQNGKPITTKEFLYMEESLLLKVLLVKTESNESIDIIRFRYAFFP